MFRFYLAVGTYTIEPSVAMSWFWVPRARALEVPIARGQVDRPPTSRRATLRGPACGRSEELICL